MHCLHFMCCERGGCKCNDSERYAQLSPVSTGPNGRDRSRIGRGRTHPAHFGDPRSPSITMWKMICGSRLNRLIGWSLMLAFACTFPGTATASIGSVDDGPLAPPLVTLAEPAVASKPPAQQARILGFPLAGPGSLLRHGNRLLVQVRFVRGALASRGALGESGVEVLDASRRYQLATVAVAPEDLEALAAVPTV